MFTSPRRIAAPPSPDPHLAGSSSKLSDPDDPTRVPEHQTILILHHQDLLVASTHRAITGQESITGQRFITASEQTITDQSITDQSITKQSNTDQYNTDQPTSRPVTPNRSTTPPPTTRPKPANAMLLPPRQFHLYHHRYPQTFHHFLSSHPDFLPEHSYYLMECSRPSAPPQLALRRARIAALITNLTPTTNPALTLTQTLTNTLLSPRAYHIGAHESIAMVGTYHTLSIYAACAMVANYVELRPVLLPPFETAQDASLKQVEILKQFRALLPELLAGRLEAAFVLRRLIPEFVCKRGVFGRTAPYWVTTSLKRDHRVLVEAFYRVLYVLMREVDLSEALCGSPCYDCGPGECLRDVDPERAEAADRAVWLRMWAGLEMEQKRVMREMVGIEAGEGGNWVAALWERVFQFIPRDLLREEGDGFFVAADDLVVYRETVVHAWRVNSTVERWEDSDDDDEMDGYADSEFAISMEKKEDEDAEMGYEQESPPRDAEDAEDAEEGHLPRAIVMVDMRDRLSDEESDVFYYESSEAEEEEETPSGQRALEDQIAFSSGPDYGDCTMEDTEEGGVPLPSATSFETVDLGEYLRPEAATPVNSEQAKWRDLGDD